MGSGVTHKYHHWYLLYLSLRSTLWKALFAQPLPDTVHISSSSLHNLREQRNNQLWTFPLHFSFFLSMSLFIQSNYTAMTKQMLIIQRTTRVYLHIIFCKPHLNNVLFEIQSKSILYLLLWYFKWTGFSFSNGYLIHRNYRSQKVITHFRPELPRMSWLSAFFL